MLTKSSQGSPFAVVGLKHGQVRLPLIAHYLCSGSGSDEQVSKTLVPAISRSCTLPQVKQRTGIIILPPQTEMAR